MEVEKSYWESLLGTEVRFLQGKYKSRVLIAGAGEPLILLHGTGGHVENYIRNIPALSTRFRVIALDFLWHGLSEATDFEPEIVPKLVDQVLDVMNVLGLEKAHIEGQSLGGWIAMKLALLHPDRVNRMVLTTTMGYEPDEGAVPGYSPPDRSGTLRSSLDVLENPTFENVRKRLARILANPEILPDEAVAVRRALYMDPAINAVQRLFVSHYLCGEEPMRYLVRDAEARKISVPTLVYWGDKNTVPPSVGRHLADQIPVSEFVSAPDTGHWAQFESAPLHDETVLRFLLGEGGRA